MQQIDHYQLQGELGRGAAGIVYRAYDPHAGRPVAIKVLLKADPRQRTRLRREILALAALRHPSIVQIHADGEWRGHPYLVLELVEGSTLQEHVVGIGTLTPKQVVAVGVALAEALELVHRSGLLHRDLKPDNVLLDAGGRPRLTDFGLVKHVTPGELSQQLTATGALLGTPGYWSPEQAAGAGGAVGPATDVYGLGGILYTALTGLPPVDGASLQELLLAAARQAPTPPSALRDDVSRDLEEVVLRCLRKDPSERYPSAGAVAAALRAANLDPGPSGRRRAVWIPLLGVALIGVSVLGWSVASGPADSGSPAAEVPPATQSSFAQAQAREAAEGAAAALPAYRALAEAGHADAMVRLGEILRGEDGAAGGDDEARRWFERAAEAGDPQGMNEWGFMLSKGRGVAKDPRAALEWYRRAAEAGDLDGMLNYGWLLKEGQGAPADPQAGLAWMERAAEAGSAPAQYLLGVALVDGRGVRAEPQRGFAYLQRAAAAGEVKSLAWVADCYRRGLGVARDPERALKHYVEAGEAGSLPSLAQAGKMLIQGDGVPKDLKRGEVLLRRAARGGDVASQRVLGQFLEAGTLGYTDSEEALRLYREVAASGDPQGMSLLGAALLGKGPASRDEAFAWLLRAAEAGWVQAMFEYGRSAAVGLVPGGGRPHATG